MDRERFRNRLKQYKKAREENPGLKYWEWKNIPKYADGDVVEDPEVLRLKQQINKARSLTGQSNEFLDNWNKARLATGRFDDQLGGGKLEQQKANRDSAPIITSPNQYAKISYMRGNPFIEMKSLTPKENLNNYIQGLQSYGRKTIRDITTPNANDIVGGQVKGKYNPDSHTIYSNPEAANNLLHEQTHASKARPQE